VHIAVLTSRPALLTDFPLPAASLLLGAHHVWGYLRTALACAGRADLVAAVDAKDLGALAQKLPLMGDA